LIAWTIPVPDGVGALRTGVVIMRPSGVSPGMDGDGRIQGGVEAEGRAPKGMFQTSSLVSCQLWSTRRFEPHYRLSLNGM